MQDIETLGILTINYNTIERKEAEHPENCKTNMSQEIDASGEYYTNTDSVSRFEKKDKLTVTDNDNNNIKYFLPSSNSDSDKRMITKITEWLQKEFQDGFNCMGCFNDTFSLQVKPDSKLHQVPPRCMAYALQWPFKEELEHLQQQDIVTSLGIDETAEWCNSFILVPKLKGKVRLCLDPARLNQALLRLVHTGILLYNILLPINQYSGNSATKCYSRSYEQY